MQIKQKIDLNQLSQLGKNYEFIRPEFCLKCNSPKIWSHGYVRRYFDGYAFCLYLKRWICADCGCVISIIVLNYFPRHHRSIDEIRKCIQYRLKTGNWIRGPDLSRQRQGHWLRALIKNIQTLLGNEWIRKPIESFNELISKNQCPVLRSV